MRERGGERERRRETETESLCFEINVFNGSVPMGVVILSLTLDSFPVRLDLNSVMEANMKGIRRSRTDLRACIVSLRKARITPTITVLRMKSSPPTHTRNHGHLPHPHFG